MAAIGIDARTTVETDENFKLPAGTKAISIVAKPDLDSQNAVGDIVGVKIFGQEQFWHLPVTLEIASAAGNFGDTGANCKIKGWAGQKFIVIPLSSYPWSFPAEQHGTAS